MSAPARLGSGGYVDSTLLSRFYFAFTGLLTPLMRLFVVTFCTEFSA